MEDVTNGESLFPHYDPTKDLSQAPKQRTKRGLGAKPLLESEIKEIQQKARSAAEAAPSYRSLCMTLSPVQVLEQV